jgi:hypothetical protein
LLNQQTIMKKSKKKEPITLVEIVSNADNSFEIRLRRVEDQAIPLLVGLLEKAKFDLLARDFDDDPQELDELPGNFMNSKFDA